LEAALKWANSLDNLAMTSARLTHIRTLVRTIDDMEKVIGALKGYIEVADIPVPEEKK
jgi:hypothetical protein